MCRPGACFEPIQMHTIRVIEELKRIRGYLENESEFFDEKLENRMNAGDKFRKED